MESKKAQGLPISTLILIIIGVVVLVLLIFGVTAGWGNIKEWLVSSDNVEQIVSQCRVACAKNSVYDWCSREMILRDKDLVDGEKDVTCKGLWGNEEYRKKYGIKECEGIVNKCPLTANFEVGP